VPKFAYKAVEGGGGTVTGALVAESQQVAMRMLQERSLYPVTVEEAKSGGSRGKKIRLRYLSTFYQQIADLLRSGVPMLRALEVLSEQDGSPPVLRQTLATVREDVAGGETLADAMDKHPNLFKDLHCAMIRAGERGGFLEDVLARLAIFAEKQDELRGKLIGAMIYPAILMMAGVAVVTGIMTFVVPRLRGHLPEESFNFLTHIVFGACDLLTKRYGLVIGGIIVVAVGTYSFCRSEYGRRTLAMLKLRAPIVGKIGTAVAVSRFCRILGTLLQNGVTILQALKIAKDSAGNEILAAEIDKAGESVRRGETLSTPLAESGLFPGDILSMIAVAEESNNLENVLVQIAETHETRTARTIETSVRLVEPLLLASMAVVVGGIAFALLLPILTMGAAGR
jgi:type II secretory pathway component PulF